MGAEMGARHSYRFSVNHYLVSDGGQSFWTVKRRKRRAPVSRSHQFNCIVPAQEKEKRSQRLAKLWPPDVFYKATRRLSYEVVVIPILRSASVSSAPSVVKAKPGSGYNFKILR